MCELYDYGYSSVENRGRSFWSHYHMDGAYIGSGVFPFFTSVKRHFSFFRWVIAITVQTPILCFKEINGFIKNGVPFSYPCLWQVRGECGPRQESYTAREFISFF